MMRYKNQAWVFGMLDHMAQTYEGRNRAIKEVPQSLTEARNAITEAMSAFVAAASCVRPSDMALLAAVQKAEANDYTVWVVGDSYRQEPCKPCKGKGSVEVEGSTFRCSTCNSRGNNNVQVYVPKTTRIDSIHFKPKRRHSVGAEKDSVYGTKAEYTSSQKHFAFRWAQQRDSHR